MALAKFREDWNHSFPGIIPVTFLFRSELPSRWFRVHSLPDSKRYAEDVLEWQILLRRHNDILDDLFERGEDLYLVAASYEHDECEELHPFNEVQSLKSLNMIPFEAIDLNRIDPECWDIGSRLVPMVTVISWEKEKFNEIIKDVANDNSRVFFFSPAKNRIVAPYDGGIDIILEDEKTKNFYRSKYHRWTPKMRLGSDNTGSLPVCEWYGNCSNPVT